jgi:exopolysaccharide biosynthesis polyprenyl glycosylphosphotransferase
MNHQTIRTLTILGDLLLINLAFMLAYVLRYRLQWLLPVTFSDPYRVYIGQQVILTFLLVLTFTHGRVWQRRRGESWLEEMSRIITATAAGITLMTAVTFFLQPSPFSRLLLFWALLLIVLFVGMARLVRRWLLAILYRRGIAVDRVLVVGLGEAGRSVIRTLLARPDLGYRTVGYLDDGTSENNIGLGRIPHLGSLHDLKKILSQGAVHTVFIALPGEMHQELLQLLHTCQAYGVRAQVVPDLLQLNLSRVEFTNMAGIPMLRARDVTTSGRLNQSGQLVKRLVDLLVVLVGAIPALPLTALIALLVKLDSRGPVFYRSPRIGRDGKVFQMVKFRSMIVGADEQKDGLRELNEADGPLFKIRDDPRLTRIGRFLRRSSLDELPQLWNVFIGEMSLVGPRPPLPEEVALYKPWHQQRLAVTGGMTGIWQVSGRSDLTFDELCLLDIYYIENWSLALDLQILLQTIPHLLRRDGAY